MSRCDNCRLRKETAKAFDLHWHGEDDCPYEHCPVPPLPKTNADKIRSATDEQLAEILTTVNRGRISAKEYLYWLRQEWKPSIWEEVQK